MVYHFKLDDIKPFYLTNRRLNQKSDLTKREKFEIDEEEEEDELEGEQRNDRGATASASASANASNTNQSNQNMRQVCLIFNLRILNRLKYFEI